MKNWLFFLTALILLFVGPAAASAFELEITNAEIDAYLQEDGSAQVEESFTYAFEGEFNGVIRSLIEPEEMTIHSVEAFEDGEPLAIEVEESEHRIQRPGEDETFTVDLTYVIEDAVVRYTDFGDFDYAFFDRSNETAYENMEIRIHAPGPSEEVLGTGFDALEDAEQQLDEATVAFLPGRVPSGENGDLRVAFDAELFPAATVTSADSLMEILEAEEREAEEAAAAAAARENVMTTLAPILIVLFAGLSLVPIWFDRRKYLPNKRRAMEKGFEKGAPDLQLSLPATMFYVQPAVTSELLTASLLDLVRQGYAEQDGDSFTLKTREGLSGHEQILTAMLFDDIGDGTTFNMSDLEQHLKKEANYNEFETKKAAWAKEVVHEKNQAEQKIPRTGLRVLAGAAGVGAIAASVMYFLFGLFLPAILLLLTGFAGIAAAALHQPRTEKGWRLLGEWHDYKKEVAGYEPEDWQRLDPDEQQLAFIYGLGLNVKSVRQLSKSMPKMKQGSAPAYQDNMIPVFMTAGLFASTQFSSSTAAASSTHSSAGTSAGGGAGAGGGGGGSGGF
ncbi:DUF2207 domain-containing protein [Bacillus daqingensis]|uniref:DUF2207 domain-containing protein n=1 Tax=Bacillus daqingensis TaxID=872396 RepID=A0ABV9NYB1_9BACI